MFIWTAIKYAWYGSQAIDKTTEAIGEGITNSYLYLAEIPENLERNREQKIDDQVKSHHRVIMEQMRDKYNL